jgi:hypothetical protein
MNVGFYAKFCHSYQILDKLEFYGQILEKYSKSIHEIPTSESLVFPCGMMGRQTDKQEDVTKLLVAFRIYVTRA